MGNTPRDDADPMPWCGGLTRREMSEMSCAPRTRCWPAIIAAAMLTVGSAHAQPAPPVSPVPVAGYEYDANGNPTCSTVASGVIQHGPSTVRRRVWSTLPPR